MPIKYANTTESVYPVTLFISMREQKLTTAANPLQQKNCRNCFVK